MLIIIRPCFPPIALPISQRSLRDRQAHSGRGTAHNMDGRVRGLSRAEDRCQCIPGYDVQLGEAENGEYKAVADH